MTDVSDRAEEKLMVCVSATAAAGRVVLLVVFARPHQTE